MIDIDALTEADKGRGVVYHHTSGLTGPFSERGVYLYPDDDEPGFVIVSFQDVVDSCHPANLTWEHEG